jgi:formylmethanofuran dehydrogenase subunit B
MNLELFSHEISNAVKSHGLYEEAAVKTASEEMCVIGQSENMKIAHVVTDAIRTEAASNGLKTAQEVTAFVNKMAHVNHGVYLDNIQQLKVASALTVDEALSRAVVQDGLDGNTVMKLASMRAYGREVFMEILRGVL